MMKTKRRFILLIVSVILLLAAIPAEASTRPITSVEYIIDSDTRQLTEAELWDWDLESLGFMFNEIFARHGFTFDGGGKYANHFNSLKWYQAVPKVDDQTAYNLTTQLEWLNYHTIRNVMSQMEAVGHPYRKTPGSDLLSWSDIHFEYTWNSLTGFVYTDIMENQRLEVYSAPSEQAWRGANGKAMVNTDGYVCAAGWENGWLLIYYNLTGGINAGGIRVGYVKGSGITGWVSMSRQLNFQRSSVTVTASCNLTDDPLKYGTVITSVQSGETVVYLTTAVNQDGIAWDYIETYFNGQLVRGYIPAGHLDLTVDTDGNEAFPEEIGGS